MPPCPTNFCIFVVETEFRHIGQAGLELLPSRDQSALASQSARITGVSHHAWPRTIFIIKYLLSIYLYSRYYLGDEVSIGQNTKNTHVELVFI